MKYSLVLQEDKTTIMHDHCFFTNFHFDPEVYYFLYVGELKSYGLNSFLQKKLSAVVKRKVECLAVVPDIHDQYYYPNIIVPASANSKQINSSGRESFRRPSSVFLKDAVTNIYINNCLDVILDHQEQLYIYMFESDPAMTFDQRENVFLLGPDKELAKNLNNKAVQFELMDSRIPMVDYRICSDLQELLFTAAELRPLWSDGIFVSRVYSAAGIGSIITRNNTEIEDFFAGDPGPFLMTRFMPHIHDPTVLAVVANEQDVFIAGIADQRIEGGNRFVGSSWPSVLSADILQQLAEATCKVGQEIGRMGYRGIFGCDFIVTDDGQPLFIEVNARKQGTTLEFCYTLEQILGKGSPNLPELEYHAVLDNAFPTNTVHPPLVSNIKLCWETYNCKLKKQCMTSGYIPQALHEQKSFQRVARGRLQKDYLVLEHVGSGFTVHPGTFLGRVVAVGKRRQDVREGLALGRQLIDLTRQK